MLDGVELPLIEIRPKTGFYDYKNKYTKGACEYLVPAPVERKGRRRRRPLGERGVPRARLPRDTRGWISA